MRMVWLGLITARMRYGANTKQMNLKLVQMK